MDPRHSEYGHDLVPWTALQDPAVSLDDGHGDGALTLADQPP